MSRLESTTQVYGQPAKYWISFSFCSTNEMFAESVKVKLVSYLKENTDYKYLGKKDQDSLVMASVRDIRIKLDAFPKALKKNAA